jgi:hypothetical protein
MARTCWWTSIDEYKFIYQWNNWFSSASIIVIYSSIFCSFIVFVFYFFFLFFNAQYNDKKKMRSFFILFHKDNDNDNTHPWKKKQTNTRKWLNTYYIYRKLEKKRRETLFLLLPYIKSFSLRITETNNNNNKEKKTNKIWLMCAKEIQCV